MTSQGQHSPSSVPPPGKTMFSEHFFRRENDGSVRLKIRLTAEEAALIEEAAGETPILPYIHRVLRDRARFHIRKRAEIDAERMRAEQRRSDVSKRRTVDTEAEAANGITAEFDEEYFNRINTR